MNLKNILNVTGTLTAGTGANCKRTGFATLLFTALKKSSEYNDEQNWVWNRRDFESPEPTKKDHTGTPQHCL